MRHGGRVFRAEARWFGIAFVLIALAVVALVGGASNGQAASQPSITVTGPVVLNDDTITTVPGQPSPGGNIGYRIQVTNNGTSTANHVSFTQSIGSTGTLVYVEATGITCPAVTATAASTLSCAASKLDPGATITVTALFRTDASALPGSDVTVTTSIAFDSQTNGQPNQKTLVVPPVTRQIAGFVDGSLAESITLHGDKLAAFGSGQTSELIMPGTFLNGIPYVGVGLQNRPDASPCTGCAPFKTDITIPPAATFTTDGPFLNAALATSPFNWKLVLPGSLLPKGFKLHGVYHDGELLPLCARDSAGNALPLTTAPGICVATLVQVSNTKTITATGLGLFNGRYQFG